MRCVLVPLVAAAHLCVTSADVVSSASSTWIGGRPSQRLTNSRNSRRSGRTASTAAAAAPVAVNLVALASTSSTAGDDDNIAAQEVNLYAPEGWGEEALQKHREDSERARKAREQAKREAERQRKQKGFEEYLEKTGKKELLQKARAQADDGQSASSSSSSDDETTSSSSTSKDSSPTVADLKRQIAKDGPRVKGVNPQPSTSESLDSFSSSAKALGLNGGQPTKLLLKLGKYGIILASGYYMVKRVMEALPSKKSEGTNVAGREGKTDSGGGNFLSGLRSLFSGGKSKKDGPSSSSSSSVATTATATEASPAAAAPTVAVAGKSVTSPVTSATTTDESSADQAEAENLEGNDSQAQEQKDEENDDEEAEKEEKEGEEAAAEGKDEQTVVTKAQQEDDKKDETVTAAVEEDTQEQVQEDEEEEGEIFDDDEDYLDDEDDEDGTGGDGQRSTKVDLSMV